MFNEVPADIRVPGVYIEIEPHSTSSVEEVQKILIIAPTSGSAVDDTIYSTPTPDNASNTFGADSVAHKMVTAAYAQTKDLPISVLAIDEPDPSPPLADISNGLAAIGDVQYHYIINYFNDKDNIDRLALFLNDRYKATSQIPGLAFVGFTGTMSEVNAFAVQFNSPFISIIGINDVDVSDAELAAAYYGQCAHSLSVDPARPLQTLQIKDVKTEAATEWTLTERDIMLNSGAATYYTDISKNVYVERPITTYRENDSGVADDSYLDITTVATAIYFRFKQRNRILSKYPRHKLTSEDVNFAPGQAILTPQLFKAEMLALYRDLQDAGIVQDFENYKSTFTCEIDSQEPTRINYQDQPIFINGMMIVAGKIQFRKQ
jgi:phage tail sheath gpL-like